MHVAVASPQKGGKRMKDSCYLFKHKSCFFFKFSRQNIDIFDVLNKNFNIDKYRYLENDSEHYPSDRQSESYNPIVRVPKGANDDFSQFFIQFNPI
jgi:hypothetical protein